jgi:ADP-ribosylglycohydrolase
MKPLIPICDRARILGGLWGAIVGDALGVPVEFNSRSALQRAPVTSLRGYGTHNQPLGTWSDDSSMLLCSVDSLIHHEFDTDDIGKRFCAWYDEGLWTPHGNVFDVGGTTANAISRMATGTPAELAGGDDEFSNGNGSLMRILPISLRFASRPIEQLLERVHRASAITHRHPRSQMACGFYSLVIRELLSGACPKTALSEASAHFHSFYGTSVWRAEVESFKRMFAEDFSNRTESEIGSSGYVVHTLEASLWCLLTTKGYQDCVLKAVNLGGDTDTTGCVAGGLAGVFYGEEGVPVDWIEQIARKNDIALLFHEFTELIYGK